MSPGSMGTGSMGTGMNTQAILQMAQQMQMMQQMQAMRQMQAMQQMQQMQAQQLQAQQLQAQQARTSFNSQQARVAPPRQIPFSQMTPGERKTVAQANAARMRANRRLTSR